MTTNTTNNNCENATPKIIYFVMNGGSPVYYETDGSIPVVYKEFKIPDLFTAIEEHIITSGEECVCDITESAPTSNVFTPTYKLAICDTNVIDINIAYAGEVSDTDIALRVRDVLYPSKIVRIGGAIFRYFNGTLNKTATIIANSVKYAFTLPRMVEVIRTFWVAAPNTLQFMLNVYCEDGGEYAMRMAVEASGRSEYFAYSKYPTPTMEWSGISYEKLLVALTGCETPDMSKKESTKQGIGIKELEDFIIENIGVRHIYLHRFLVILSMTFRSDTVKNLEGIPYIWTHILYHNCRFFDSKDNATQTIEHFMNLIKRGNLLFHFKDLNEERMFLNNIPIPEYLQGKDEIHMVSLSRIGRLCEGERPVEDVPFRSMRVKLNDDTEFYPFAYNYDNGTFGLGDSVLDGSIFSYFIRNLEPLKRSVILYIDRTKITMVHSTITKVIATKTTKTPTGTLVELAKVSEEVITPVATILEGPKYTRINTRTETNNLLIIGIGVSLLRATVSSNSDFAKSLFDVHFIPYIPEELDQHIGSYPRFTGICDNNKECSPEFMLSILTALLLQNIPGITHCSELEWTRTGTNLVYKIWTIGQFSLTEMEKTLNCRFAEMDTPYGVSVYMDMYAISKQHLPLFKYGYEHGLKRVNVLAKIGKLLGANEYNFDNAVWFISKHGGVEFPDKYTVRISLYGSVHIHKLDTVLDPEWHL